MSLKTTLAIFINLYGVCAVFLSGVSFAVETVPDKLSRENSEFFENRIRPLLVEKCYGCHSATGESIEGGLQLDSRQGVAAGGDSGPIIADRDPAASILIQAVRWTDPSLEMPPSEKLSDRQIADLERWVSLGVPDPREAADSVATEKRTIDLEEGRKWWAFQPLEKANLPKTSVEQQENAIDSLVHSKLTQHNLALSPAAEPATLLRRAYLDLTGLRPSYEQIEAFECNPDEAAYEQVLEKLLDSPQYGERWGRYWLDVVRYGEDNFTGEATTPRFPFAWRYRDWVIDSVNKDVPYDRFVKLQLAADLMSDVDRTDFVALGFLGAAPSYHKDGRLSKDVVETLYTDDWDERVDTVSRGLLGLTVSCARCHDHKFDPILTSDYYSLASVFASTVQAPRPLADIDPAVELKFMVDSQRVFYLSYVSNLMRDDPGSKPVEAREKVIRFTEEMEQIKDSNSGLRDSHSELYEYISRLARRPNPYPDQPQPERDQNRDRSRRGRRGQSEMPMFQAVYDAGFFVDGSDPDLTMLDIRPDQPHDLHILPGGNVSRPGELSPRGFPSVLAKGDREFHVGSGRLELAHRIFDDSQSLAARVIVNRVWGWHFGKPLVPTPSDFGTQGEPPTHPELLDDLAARFVENGYSLKWLHREIMTSATYQQSSRPRDEAIAIDPDNHWLWRMNPRRLDIEAYRDCLLQAAGTLDRTIGGPSVNLDQSDNPRRTVYGYVGRERTNTLLQLYDFPAATMHSPQRETTISPLQQLFTMNSEFIQKQAETLASHIDSQASDSQSIETEKVSQLYRHVLGRDPSKFELKIADEYLQHATLAEYTQALFATNEVIFWP